MRNPVSSRPLIGMLFVLAAALSLAGCAAGRGAAADDGRVAVRVENNLIPASPLTVYAQPRVGTRVRLGFVGAGETQTLRFNPTTASGEYVLVGETVSGANVVSNPVVISGEATIHWTVASNIATVQ